MKRKMLKIKRDYYKIEKWAKKGETRNITPPQNPLARLKFYICNEFNNYMGRHNIKQKDLADILKVKPSKISDLANFKLDSVSFDRIFNYLVILSDTDDHIKELLASFLENPILINKSLKMDSQEKLLKKIEFIEIHDDYSEEFDLYDGELLSA